MATAASHAAGLELRQTVWTMQVLARATGLEGSERYRLIATVDQIPRCVCILSAIENHADKTEGPSRRASYPARN
jgi:hypothetical protein